MKRALLMFAMTLLAPQVADASYEPKKEKVDKEKSKKISVPEPTTIALLGAAAGAAAARKLWRNRQR